MVASFPLQLNLPWSQTKEVEKRKTNKQKTDMLRSIAVNSRGIRGVSAEVVGGLSWSFAFNGCSVSSDCKQ